MTLRDNSKKANKQANQVLLPNCHNSGCLISF